MDPQITQLIEVLLLPPAGPLLLTLLGLLLLLSRFKRTGGLLAFSGVAALWFACTPIVAYTLLHSLEIYPALDAKELRGANAQAIVILGSGRHREAPEYGGDDTVSRWGLERLRYGAQVHRITGLPIVVTGGAPDGEATAEATFMGNYLETELEIADVWREGKSRTTAENARYTAALLKEKGIQRVLLVTHAWHEARAVESFRREGLDVVAAPTSFAEKTDFPRNWLPRARDLELTYAGLHEWIGRVVYALRTIER